MELFIIRAIGGELRNDASLKKSQNLLIAQHCAST